MLEHTGPWEKNITGDIKKSTKINLDMYILKKSLQIPLKIRHVPNFTENIHLHIKIRVFKNEREQENYPRRPELKIKNKNGMSFMGRGRGKWLGPSFKI